MYLKQPQSQPNNVFNPTPNLFNSPIVSNYPNNIPGFQSNNVLGFQNNNAGFPSNNVPGFQNNNANQEFEKWSREVLWKMYHIGRMSNQSPKQIFQIFNGPQLFSMNEQRFIQMINFVEKKQVNYQ